MILLFKKILAVATVIIILSVPLLISQNLSNPLFPVNNGVPQDIGLFVAIGQNYQSGTMYVECPECYFKDGTKFGWTIGALYEREALDWMRYGMMLSFDDFSVKSQFKEYEFFDFTNKLGLRTTFPVEFHHTADANFKFFSAIPYIKINPFRFFFVRLGGSFSFAVSGTIKHDKELLTKTVTAGDGTVFDVQYEKNLKSVQTIENGDFSGLNSFQFMLVPMIGFDIKASERIHLSPFFMMDLPVTKFSNQGDAFNIGTWRLAFEFRYALTKPKSWEQ